MRRIRLCISLLLAISMLLGSVTAVSAAKAPLVITISSVSVGEYISYTNHQIITVDIDGSSKKSVSTISITVTKAGYESIVWENLSAAPMTVTELATAAKSYLLYSVPPSSSEILPGSGPYTISVELMNKRGGVIASGTSTFNP